MADRAYCIYCGSPLAEGSAICPVCKKVQDDKENLFKVFLWKNTKETIRGEIDDTLFNIIKNWLMSRLYGLILLLTVIAVVTYVAANRPHVSYDTVRSGERPVSGQGSGTSDITDETEIERIRDEVYDAVDLYKESVFYWTVEDDPYIGWANGGYQGEIPERPETYQLPSQYGTGRHEYIYDQGLEEWDYSIDRDSMVLNDPSTDLGKELLSKGYTVAEMIKHDVVPNGNGQYAGPGEYLFVLVEIDGVWYVAEDFVK